MLCRALGSVGDSAKLARSSRPSSTPQTHCCPCPPASPIATPAAPCPLTEPHPVVVAQAVHLLAEVLQHPGGHAVDVERRGRARSEGERRLLQGHGSAVPLRTALCPQRGHQRMVRARPGTAATGSDAHRPLLFSPRASALRGCPHSLSQRGRRARHRGKSPRHCQRSPAGSERCFLLRLTSGAGPRCKSDFPFHDSYCSSLVATL